MVREALTTYWSLVSGVTDVTRQRATATAKALAAQGEATVGQIGGLAEEILETSKANRTALVSLVRYEIDRALGRLGLANTDEVTRLRERVDTLEREVGELRKAAQPAPKQAPAKAAKAAKAARTADAKAPAKATAKAPAKAAKTAKAPAKKAAKKVAR